MPFGFWVLGNYSTEAELEQDDAESQMPFGFWVLGNAGHDHPSHAPKGGVSNAFRLLGSGERGTRSPKPRSQRRSLKCLSAFGFWGTERNLPKGKFINSVSNAFRLLGSGERSDRGGAHPPVVVVSNAFRLLGSGEL